MPDQRYDEPDAVLRGLLVRAAQDTVPPTPFDVGGTVAGGRRRVAHRRRMGAAGVLAVALVAAAVAVAPGLGDPQSAPPADGNRQTDGADRVKDETSDQAALARLLADSSVGYTGVLYDGPSASAAVARDCDNDCTSAVLLTDDGWDTHVAQLLPDGAGNVWMRLMSDGAVAVVPDTGGAPFVLSPDGSTSALQVSTEPVRDGTDAVLVNGPTLRDGSTSWNDVWALNAGDRSLRPLAEQPPGPLVGMVDSPSPGMTIGPIPATSDSHGMQLAITTDDGRSWTTRPGPPPNDGANASLHVGQDGHLAVTFTGDGATIAPFEQLFLSDDSGETWREVPAEHHPGSIGGVAFTPDGRLLIADYMEPQLWQVTAGGTDLEKVGGDVPPMRSLWSSGGMLAGQTGGRTLYMSDDGRTWRSVTPGLS